MRNALPTPLLQRLLATLFFCFASSSLVQAGTLGPLTYQVNGEVITITDCDTSVTNVVVPATIESKPVTAIGHFAFNGCSSLTEITLPYGITSIGNFSFFSCSALTNISLPDSVTNIGILSFSACSSLASMTIPTNVASIGGGVFSECNMLEAIIVEEGNLNYSSNEGVLFSIAQTELIKYPAGKTRNTYSIPSGVTNISVAAFSQCILLETVTIPASVTSIGNAAFQECSVLSSVIFDGNAPASFGTDVFTDTHANLTIYYRSASTGFTSPTWQGFPAIPLDLTYEANGDSITITGSDTNASGFLTIPSTIEGKSVTSIGDNAFQGCSSLTGISFATGTTNIGANAFLGCTSLTGVELPVGVTSIGDSAFSGCSSLADIELPATVINIGAAAFYGCTSLTGAVLPTGITSIADSTFYGCSSLAGIELPTTVTNIGAAAFYGCTSLTDVELPVGVTNIGDSTFSGCSSLTGIELPSTVTNIGASAFYGCTSLTDVELPVGVTSIGDSAFENCSDLRTVIFLGDAPSTIGSGVFSGVNASFVIYYQNDSSGFTVPTWQGYPTVIWPWTYVTNNGTIAITGCETNTSGAVIIPTSIEGKPVTSIDSYAFRDCSLLTNIMIPPGVTTIGGAAFQFCSELISIDVEAENLHYTSIDGVLYNAGATHLLRYPGAKAGYYTFPASVTGMEYYAFSASGGLTGILLPQWFNSSLYAFSSCTNLEAIDIEAGHLQYSSLDGVIFNTNLTELIKFPVGKPSPYSVPNGVTSIRSFSFGACNSLVDISFSSSVTNIGSFAFRHCTSLTNVTIRPDITLHPEALLECTGLLDIHIDPTHPNYTSIDGVLFTKDLSELTAWPAGRSGSYAVPEGTVSIGSDAFSESGLTDITFPSSLTNITDWAFSQCHSLINITIPDTVTNIGREAFSPAEQLRSATFLGDAPATFESGAFRNTNPSFTIHYLSSNTGFTSPTWKGYPATSWFMDNGLDPVSANLDQDINGDGVTLLTAYALNLNPTLNLSGSLPQAVLTPSAMSMVYFAASPGITYILETSTNLVDWTDADISLSGLDENNEITATVDTTVPHRFLRLRIEQ